MLRKDVVALWNVLEQIKNKEFKNFKFTYALVKNKKKIQPEIETLREISKPSIEFQNYSEKRIELLKKLAKKDEKGNPIIKNRIFMVEDDHKSKVEIEKLNKEYQQVIDENKTKEEEFERIMNDEVDIELHKVELKNISEESLTPAQMEILLFMIKE